MKKMYADGDEVYLITGRFMTTGNLSVDIILKDGEIYSNLTVNTKTLPENYGSVDVNNFPEALEFIKKYKLGKITGKSVKSGYCEYPVIEFDMEKLKEYEAPENLREIFHEG